MLGVIIFINNFRSISSLYFDESCGCLCVVLLSFCEGFGIPLLEGFGYGKPALTSNLMSLPEVVGKAGCMVNPYHINEIADGFKQITENIQEYIKHIPTQLVKFDFHNSVEKFMDALEIHYKRIYN